jgi:hypothetical protein
MSPLVKTEVVVGENTAQLLAEATATLNAPAVKIRNVVADVSDLKTDILPGNVILEGNVRLNIFYVGLDTVVHHQAEDLPFCTYVVIAPALPGMKAEVYPTVERVLPELKADGTSVVLKVILDILVKVSDARQLYLKEGEGPRYLFHQVRGENTVQQVNESAVPLSIAALKVTDVTARIEITGKEVIDDKVIIEGYVHKQIFYVGLGDELEHHQAEGEAFSTFVDMPGVGPGMSVQVNPKVEEVVHELSPDGTQLSLKVAYELFVKVTEDVELSLAAGSTLIKAQEIVGEGALYTLVESTYALNPVAQKINQVTAEVDRVETTVIPGKVIIQGNLHKRIYFTGTDNINYEQEEDLPFMGYVAIAEAAPGMTVRVSPQLKGIIPNLAADGTTLAQKVMLEIGVKVLRTVQAAVAEVTAL